MASKKPTYADLQKRVLKLEKSMADSDSGYSGRNSTKEIYREIYNYFDEAVIVQDLDTGKFLDVNNGFCRMYGISYEDALSDDLFEMLDISPPYSEADLVEWVRKTRDEGPQNFEWQARRKSGDTFWVNVSLKKALIGGQERGLAIIRDITEQKLNKEALEKRILALTQPLDNVSGIAFENLFNLDDIQCLQDQFAAATGVASLITHTDGTPITQPSNFSRMCGDFIRQTEKGRAKCIQSDATLGRLCKDGPIVRNCLSCGFCGAGAGISVGGRHIANWLIGQVRDETQTEEQMRRYAREIDIDESEFIKAYLEVPIMDPAQFKRIAKALFTLANQLSNIAFQNVQQARFINERQKAETALKNEKDFIETLLNNLPGLFYILDQEGNILRWNKTAEKITGYNAGEIAVMKNVDFFAEEYQEKFQESVKEVWETGQTYMEANLRTKDGSLIPYYFNSYKMNIDGKPCIVGMALDISKRRRAEEALRESEKQFRTLVESAMSIILKVDTEGNITFFNKFAEDFFGYPQEEIIGRNALGTIVPITDSAGNDLSSVVDGVTKHPELYASNENENMRSNGERVWVTWTNTPIFGADNEVKEILCVGNDITGRRRMEEKLRFFQMAVEWATDAIGMSTPEGRHFYQNQAYTEMFRGMSVEEVDGQSGPPSTVFENEAQGRQIFSTVTAGKSWSGEVRMVNKSGEKLDTLLRGYPIKDDTGKVIGLVGVHSDISESKRAENALRESEEKYRTIFNSAQVGMFRTRIEDGLVIECNNQAARIFGFDKREDCIDKLIVSEVYVDPEDRKQMIDLLRKSGELDNFETRFYRKDREIAWVRITINIYPDRGYLEGVIVDITAQKQAEAERARLEDQLRHAQKMESIGRLAGGLAHDFSNMLTPIIGYAELALMDMNKEDKLYEPLTTIMKAAESASALTRQLLAFSRKQVLQLKVVNLNTVVHKFSKMIQRLIGEDIELHLSLSPSLGNVKVDTDQINQILMNLAVNARDAMPSGGKLTIETANVFLDDDYRLSHPYARSGENVMLAVTDNGCGMDAEIQKHLFEPFYTTKGMTEGTGLGLSTVYGLTKQHGGHIQVYSEVNHGTSFKIFFPQADDLEDTTSPAPEQSRRELPRGTETILLVEDEEMIRKLAGEIIELKGYNVLYAGSAAEALEIAGKSGNDIDLLLTDVIMPGMNGKELYEKVKFLVPGIKVIFTSGYTDDVITHHGVLEEGVDFLQKPFSGQSLLLKIRQTLDRTE